MSRRKARESAFKLIFEYCCNNGVSPGDLVDYYSAEADPPDLPSVGDPFAKGLFIGTAANLSQIDGMIDKYSKDWDIGRLSKTTAAILRIAAYELMFELGTPGLPIIDEALELAKIYDEPKSKPFINGVLDAIFKEVREESILNGKENSVGNTD